jgi:hypothetical protein
MAAAKRDPMYCEHDRTAATCEECAHADALKDPRRSAATRDELYPFPNGGAIMTAFLSENGGELEPSPNPQPPKRRRRST